METKLAILNYFWAAERVNILKLARKSLDFRLQLAQLKLTTYRTKDKNNKTIKLKAAKLLDSSNMDVPLQTGTKVCVYV